MTAPIPEPGPIVRIDDGMRVLDSNGEEVGTVLTTKMGDPEAVTPAGQRMPGDLVDTVVDSFAGAEPDVHPQRAAQLLRTGYIKIDAKGWFARNLYAGAEEIDRVDDAGVRLAVPRSRLVPED